MDLGWLLLDILAPTVWMDYQLFYWVADRRSMTARRTYGWCCWWISMGGLAVVILLIAGGMGIAHIGKSQLFSELVMVDG